MSRILDDLCASAQGLYPTEEVCVTLSPPEGRTSWWSAGVQVNTVRGREQLARAIGDTAGQAMRSLTHLLARMRRAS